MATIRKLRGKWQAQVRRKGLPPRAKSFEKKSDAERWARELEAEVDRTGAMLDTRSAEATTLKALLTRYRDEITPLKRGAAKEIARLNAIMRRPICHRTIATLSSADIAAYRDKRLETVAPAAVVRELNTISHALEVAQREWGITIHRNPVKLVRRPTLPRGRTRRLNGDEEERILAACDRGRTPLLKPLVILAIETGMRRGELLSMQWDDVDLERRVAHLALTKNGDSRDVPLSTRATQTLRALLESREDDQPLVFPISGNAVRLAWERLRVRASVADLHFHDLRHEAISRLFEKGLGVAEVSTISGHRELRMLQRYTHLRAVDLVARIG